MAAVGGLARGMGAPRPVVMLRARTEIMQRNLRLPPTGQRAGNCYVHRVRQMLFAVHS